MGDDAYQSVHQPAIVSLETGPNPIQYVRSSINVDAPVTTKKVDHGTNTMIGGNW